jgi:hypothetical protein
VIVVWFCSAVFAGLVDGQSATTDQQNVLMQFLQPLTSSTTIPLIGNILAAVTDVHWWSSCVTMATFDFPNIFPPESSWQLIRWGVFMTLGMAFMLTLTLAVFRGTPST